MNVVLALKLVLLLVTQFRSFVVVVAVVIAVVEIRFSFRFQFEREQQSDRAAVMREWDKKKKDMKDQLINDLEVSSVFLFSHPPGAAAACITAYMFINVY